MVTADLPWPVRPAETVLKNPPGHTDQAAAFRKWSHEHWLLAGLYGFVGTALIAIVPGFSNATRVAEAAPARLELALPLPAASAEAGNASGWQTVRIQRGENLGSVFAQLKLSPALMHQLLEATSARDSLTRLREGQEIGFEFDAKGVLKTLRFDKDPSTRIDLVVAGGPVCEK
jgi:hypothetical protein